MNVLVFTVCGGTCGECSCLHVQFVVELVENGLAFDSLWWSLWRMVLSVQFVMEFAENVLAFTVCGGTCREWSCL